MVVFTMHIVMSEVCLSHVYFFFFFYIYTGKAEASGSMHVTLCDYIMPWDSLSTTQKKSLSQRYQMGCDCKVRQQRAAFACAVYLVAWRKKDSYSLLPLHIQT